MSVEIAIVSKSCYSSLEPLESFIGRFLGLFLSLQSEIADIEWPQEADPRGGATADWDMALDYLVESGRIRIMLQSDVIASVPGGYEAEAVAGRKNILWAAKKISDLYFDFFAITGRTYFYFIIISDK